MSKRFKIFSCLMALVLAIGCMAGCNKKTTSSGDTQTKVDLSSANGDGKTVAMALLYTDDTRMTLDQQYAPWDASAINGKKYQKGALKPAFAQLQTNLNFTIKDVTESSATSVSDSFSKMRGKAYRGVNILNGPVSDIVDGGTENGAFINLNLYQDELPDFFNFVNAHDIVKKSITSDNGAIYYSPYFDGFDDIETMFICRTDYVERLLDNFVDDVTNTPYDTGLIYLTDDQNKLNQPFVPHYNGFYDTLNTTYKAVDADGKGTHDVHVEYTSGNGVIALQNKLDASQRNGFNMVKVLVNYIKEHYITPGYITKPSELFIGQNACYNADELIALLRCVKTNPKYLTREEGKIMVPFFPRHTSVDRIKQVLQLVQIWGVRGYDSRNGYLYIDENGVLQDARVSDDMMEALGFLHQIYEEGLIAKDYPNGISTGATEWRETVINDNTGFMMYDYNQTTTVFNTTIGNTASTNEATKALNLSPILFPVADWDNKAVKNNDGTYKMETNDLYMYTESWRSVKTEGWAITRATADDPDVLKKCLEIFNYMFTDEGQRLMTYGPDEFIEKDADGKIVMTDYNGKEVPKISEATLKDLNGVGKGNYTNYYRRYVGSTLPIGFVKEQGMEYQTVDPKGTIGLDYINTASKLDVLKHASVTRDTTKIQNSLVPTSFAINRSQVQAISKTCADLNLNFNDASTSGQNIFHQYILYGFGANNGSIKTLTKEQLVDQINKTWKLNYYMNIYRNAYNKMYA